MRIKLNKGNIIEAYDVDVSIAGYPEKEGIYHVGDKMKDMKKEL